MPGASRKLLPSGLTMREECFCRAVALADMPIYQAHAEAYPDWDCDKKIRYEESSRMLSKPKISQRIQEIRQEAFSHQFIDRELIVSRLWQIAQQDDNLNASVRACVQIGEIVAPDDFVKRSESLIKHQHDYGDLLELLGERKRALEGRVVASQPIANSTQKLSAPEPPVEPLEPVFGPNDSDNDKT